MPLKKPNKAAKKPGKATPGKVSHKVAAPKKAARPPAKHTPMTATPKVKVKPNKPAPQPAIAKIAPVKASARTKPEPLSTESNPDDVIEITDKLGPVKFDTRKFTVRTPTRSWLEKRSGAGGTKLCWRRSSDS